LYKLHVAFHEKAKVYFIIARCGPVVRMVRVEISATPSSISIG